jgi:putative addiction module CopG family antidote
MDIAISRELLSYIRKKTRSGEFDTPSDVVNFALRRLKEREKKLAWLRAELQKGLDSLERGEGSLWNVEETKARLLQRYEQQQQRRKKAS